MAPAEASSRLHLSRHGGAAPGAIRDHVGPGSRLWRLLQRGLLGLLLASVLLLGDLEPVAAAMDYAKQVLIGADFRGADLRGVTFNLTNLRDADFHGADLRNASLFGAKLQDADLAEADLRDATLDSAVFDGTDLRNARLDDAFAFNTKFSNVLIEGADFTNVPLRGDALKALCAIASGTNPSSGRATRDTLGCA
ncbi:MAG: pentapeptide repeat-containing protein [Synechococcaceae cyanobacterium ELA263]